MILHYILYLDMLKLFKSIQKWTGNGAQSQYSFTNTRSVKTLYIYADITNLKILYKNHCVILICRIATLFTHRHPYVFSLYWVNIFIQSQTTIHHLKTFENVCMHFSVNECQHKTPHSHISYTKHRFHFIHPEHLYE